MVLNFIGGTTAVLGFLSPGKTSTILRVFSAIYVRLGVKYFCYVSFLLLVLCEDNLDPQLDQGNEEVIRVALLTFDLKR